MDMKKAFVSLGIGVLVVTGLIQSGVIDVNQVFTTGDSAQDIDLAGKTRNEKWSGGPTQNQSTSQSSSSTDQTTTRQTKVSSGPVGGVIVPGKIQEVKVKRTCTALIAETTFTPGKETFLNPPLLATVESGEYLVTAEGKRCQDFYEIGGTTPKYCRMKDADGNTLDNADGKITQFFGKDATFPQQPYGAFVLRVNGMPNLAGKSYDFSIKVHAPITMDINVPNNAFDRTGTGSFNVKLYRCGK